ncbi:MAG: hypothetical protein AB1500_03190 [Bacillota bacterium]
MPNRLVVALGLLLLTLSAGCGSTDISNKSAGSAYESEFKPDIKGISGIINMSKDGVVGELGNNYEFVDAGPEGAREGYYFVEYGLTFVFDDDHKIVSIDCDQMVDINGARAGMDFAQVQKKLGGKKIAETSYGIPENKAYELSYWINECKVVFSSFEEDGRDSWVTVYKEDKADNENGGFNGIPRAGDDTERVKVLEVTADIDKDGKSERILLDREKEKAGDSSFVYSRILVFDERDNRVFNSKDYITDLRGGRSDGFENGLVKVDDLDGDGAKEIYFCESGSKPVIQKLAIVGKCKGSYRLLFFETLGDCGYRDFDNDRKLELYGRTRNAQFLCWSGRDTVYSRSEDRYIPSYSCTRRLWEEKCRQSEKVFQDKPDMDSFGELITSYAVLGYKDKGLEIINNSRVLGRYESKEDWALRFEECLKSESAWLNSLK